MKATATDEGRALLERLPDDASLNDIQYHIYVRQKIERGLDAIRRGDVIPQEEIEKRMARWLER
jgi:predicted transcriptional regulator